MSLKTEPTAGRTEVHQVDMVGLKRKSVRGGVVTLFSQAVSVLIQLLSTVILARLLSPEDYGLIAMVTATTAFAGLFRDLGLSAAVIQKQSLSHAQMSNLFWLNAAMGASLTVLLALASPIVSLFYDKPELLMLTLALSSTFVISALGTQHGALLVRELKLGRKAASTILGSLVTLIIAVTLAWLNFRYWALAVGTIAGALTTTISLFCFTRFVPSVWTKGAGIKSLLSFGANVTVFDFVNYFHRNLDNILIGQFWGSQPLGYYSRAYTLLMFPIQAIRGPINTVAFPALSQLNGQPESFTAYYRKVTQILAFLSMPLTAFLFVASGPVINLLLTEKWSPVSDIFCILAATAFIQPAASLRGTVLLATGQSKKYAQWGIANAICVSVGFAIGVTWGPVGVAASYAIVNYLLLYPSLKFAFGGSPLEFKDFLVSVTTPGLCSLLGVLACYFVPSQWLGQHPDWLQVMILGSVFTVSCMLFPIISPKAKSEFSYFVNLLRSGGKLRDVTV